MVERQIFFGDFGSNPNLNDVLVIGAWCNGSAADSKSVKGELQTRRCGFESYSPCFWLLSSAGRASG